MKTDNVTTRFPELVGALGVVDTAPIHPSTWFTVKVVDSGRLVKLQTTAMKPLNGEKVSPQTDYMQQTPEKEDEKVIHSPSVPAEHSEHHHRPFSNVGIAQFTKGVAVKILGTNNVLQRVPHLVGMVGNIKDVPVHPITWFKIEFPSGQVVTFRPSAFKLDDGRDDVIIQKPVKKPVVHSVETKKAHSASKEKEAESDFSIGMRVRIRSGELSGAVGEIMRFGNGWIQVLTSEGKIAKRAHELDFMDSSRPVSKVPRSSNSVSSDKDYNLSEGERIKRSKSGRVIKTHPQYNTTGDNDSEDSESLLGGKRIRSNSDLDSTDFDASHKGPQNLHGKYNKNKENRNPVLKAKNRNYLDLEHLSSDCPFPLISLQQRQAKRVNTQQYVDREAFFNSGRPDLSYWLTQFKAAFFLKDGSEEIGKDQTYEVDPLSCKNGINTMDCRNMDSETDLFSPRSMNAITTMTDMFIIDNQNTVEEKVIEPSSPPSVTPTYGYTSAPLSECRHRSDSLCETDCEDNMSPDLLALSGSLSYHQKATVPSMPAHMLLPPHAIHSSQSIAALYDSNAKELCPARFFLSSSSLLSPRDAPASSPQEMEKEVKETPAVTVTDVRKSHSDWSNLFSTVPIQSINNGSGDEFLKRKYSGMSSNGA